MSLALVACDPSARHCPAPTDGGVTATFVDGGVALSVAASRGALVRGFDVAIHGSAAASGTSFAIDHDQGTVTVAGRTMPALVYQRDNWPEIGQVLYGTVAVAPDLWTILYFYCQGSVLTQIYIEDTRGGPPLILAGGDLDGTCAESSSRQDVAVAFPASTLDLGAPATGFAASGPALTQTSATTGTMTSCEDSWTVFPFAEVDCSTACGSPGWYELHSIYWSAQEGAACFGIFYLDLDDRAHVELHFSLCLPDLRAPSSSTFAATWTGP
jgi:hypothetical protein